MVGGEAWRRAHLPAGCVPGEVSVMPRWKPGDALVSALATKGWDQRTLARVLGRPVQMVNEVVQGKKRITTDTAHQLEAAGLGDAVWWMRVQSLWDLRRKPVGLAAIRRRAASTKGRG